MNGHTPSKRGALPLLLHSQFNTSLWFMKTRNDAASVMKKSVRKIGVRSFLSKQNDYSFLEKFLQRYNLYFSFFPNKFLHKQKT